MVRGIVDSAILVDVLREYEPALQWLNQQNDLAVSQAIWLEVLQGVTDGRKQRKTLTLLRELDIVETLPADFNWAIEKMLNLHLSHNVGMMDCLIASTSHRLQIPLYTTNLKHFTPLIGSLAVKPY